MMARFASDAAALPEDVGGEELCRALESASAKSFALVQDLEDFALFEQFDPEFSPIGWHIGHIAWQKECWLLRRLAGRRPIAPDREALWDSFVSEKTRRGPGLPERDQLVTYARQVHEQSLELVARVGSVDSERRRVEAARLVRFVANHERQHAEIIATVRLLGELYLESPISAASVSNVQTSGPSPEFVEVDPLGFVLGNDDDRDAWDNEHAAHHVNLEPFLIQRAPVSCGAFVDFIRSGGYADERWWSPEGNAWRIATSARAPRFWLAGADGWLRRTLGGVREVDPALPVCHVSWYEADAFARFAGARLPSEAEWEAAASWDSAAGRKRRFPWGDDASATPANLGLCLLDVAGPGAFAGGASPCGAVDMAGGVWEWVADTFEPYPGFLPQAYAGYSAPWFGARHRCARGGSFMTQAEIARCCFRNWYEPHLRAPTLGFRLARSLRSP